MDVLDKDTSLAQLRGNLDLMLRAQRHGRTGYIISDARSGRVFFSDSLCELRKIPRKPFYTREEGIEFIHPEDRERFLTARAKAAKDGQEFELEMRIVGGDGSIIWERSNSQPQFDANGDFTGLLSVIQNVTESKAVDTSLKEQEATYRTLFNSIGDSIFLTLGGIFVECNEAAQRMFGATREQLVGNTPVQFSPAFQPDGCRSEDKAREKIQAAIGGTKQVFEWRHKRLDGSEFDAEVVLSRVEGSTEPYFFGVVRDISERKKAEIALKASHDKFAGAFNSAADAMIVATVGEQPGTGLIVDLNDAAVAMLGRSREQMIGKMMNETGVHAGLSHLTHLRGKLVRGEAFRDYPAKLRRPDGSNLDTLINGTTFYRENEHLALLTVRDVTDAYEAERRIHELNASLEDSLRLVRAIADNLPVAITYQDRDGVFRFANQTMENWFASPPGGLLGMRVADLVSPAYLAAIQPMRDKVGTGNGRIEGTVPYPDNVTRTVEATIVQDRSPDGSIRGRYTLLIDMTERKAAEQQLQQSQKMQAIGKLTGGVAHDFNNLLGVITGNLELATDALGPGAEKIARLLEPARRAAERGSTLTRSLLSFARQQALSPQVTDLNTLARDMTELLRRTMPSNIAIEYVGGAGLWTCEVDAGQLQNALLNLVVNARDAMPDGGRLTIETRNTRVDADYAAANPDLAPGQYVMLAVSDTGTGMAAEVIARAFEPFYTTKGLGQGTGLGLSMVYGFAKQSGGHVAIYSEVGSGTSAKLYLPRFVGAIEAAAPPAPRDMPGARNETVLVVEDDEDMRLITVTMLRSLGYIVLEAASGVKGLDIVNRRPELAAIVTDVVLAGSMNGRRLAQEAQGRRPGLPVLYMSGYTEDAILHHGRLDPGVHFIQKPFRKHDLAAKLREALDAKSLP